MVSIYVKDLQGKQHDISAEELADTITSSGGRIFTPDQLRRIFHTAQHELERRNGYLSAFKEAEHEA